MIRFRAVLFDLDGTLLDTLEDLATSMNNVLQRRGFPVHEREAYRFFVGKGMENLVRCALPESNRDEATIAACTRSLCTEYKKRWAETTRPYYGVPKMLNWLQDHGIHKAVLSNKSDEFTREMVARLLPHWKFAVVRGALKSVPLKPDPTSALAIAQQMGLEPSAFCYLGDSAIDMHTATAAGMYPIGVRWGFRDAEELVEGGAQTLLERPTDLAGVVAPTGK
jgi:phosphoglycolate phosphatase